jgi:hypothetical protein
MRVIKMTSARRKHFRCVVVLSDDLIAMAAALNASALKLIRETVVGAIHDAGATDFTIQSVERGSSLRGSSAFLITGRGLALKASRQSLRAPGR